MTAIASFVEAATELLRWWSADDVPADDVVLPTLEALGKQAEAALSELDPSVPAEVREALERTSELMPLVVMALEMGSPPRDESIAILGRDAAAVIRWWRAQ